MATDSSGTHARGPQPSKYVTVTEFADYWGCSVRTIWRDISKGALDVERVGPTRRVRIKRSVMESYGRPND